MKTYINKTIFLMVLGAVVGVVVHDTVIKPQLDKVL